jgi:hypothetical protein
MLKDLIKKNAKKEKPKEKNKDKFNIFENELEIFVYENNKLISQKKHK